ncbi:tRNA (adenosine(37)-N6)-threonylcarbamoyltransferase complex dimerization subunit type 1 TsaB [Sphingomonas sp. PAMC 26621]|uniref:tRNA (adenosine(37)-N6)-threonylcarbamoyltransferase complex dimerization subunit type 1 TsaB n=1 Tax=Sphingomonas sp. PAMC 26621 TaxID=1112213 RepID=UPI000289152F|nr:tRNA (adenosine(37)-N6)-threonylcarbamoyltransferase complex dimerization subunit type 1 TsaB [Sphingomonas sp. PAMC 26621]
MRTLVIETATAACSVALIADGRVTANRHEVVGRGHAERLIAMIAELPEGGRAEQILVDCGPGSFTGIRVGIAAARGLALGWGVPVSGYSSLALLAAAAFGRDDPGGRDLPDLAVVLEGGHGEVFMQGFAAPLRATAPFVSLRPEAALDALLATTVMVGNGVRFLAAIAPDRAYREMLPDAASATLLPSRFATLPAVPIYGRAPDAKPAATPAVAAGLPA